MEIPYLQIPKPYNFIVQVAHEHQPIFESYFCQFVQQDAASKALTMIRGVHIESERMRECTFEHHPLNIGYDTVLGYIVIRVDGEIMYQEGDVEQFNKQ